MSSVLKLSLLSAIVAISTILTHPLSAFASTLYSNMFIDNLSNWQQEFGLCNVSPTGLSCNGTGTYLYQIGYDNLACISGDFNLNNSGTQGENLILSNSGNNLNSITVLFFNLGGDIKIRITPGGDYDFNYVPQQGLHKYTFCQTPKDFTIYLDNSKLETLSINHDMYKYFGIQLQQGDSLTNFIATDTLPGAQEDLAVPILKQTDSNWATQEYDSASIWSPSDPNFSSWGCAVTSAAMVFQYYGITKMPDGTPLNPGSLNSWLKTQDDGYIGNGLLNWLALSRLSYKALQSGNNPSLPFDALEYTRNATSDASALTSDLNHNIPDILEEPGHFVVAKGINNSTFDINDPFYDRTTLSNGYNNTFSVLGSFVPNQTDLSYIMVTSNNNLSFTIKDSLGNIVNNSFTQQPIISKPGNLPTGDPTQILYLPKPPTGNYQLLVTDSKIGEFTAIIYQYNQIGNVEKSTIAGIGSTNPNDNTFSFHFDKSNLSNDTITKTPTFSSTLDDLKNLRSLNMIDQGSFSSLSSLVKNAQNYSWLKFINDLQLQSALTVLKAQAHKMNIVAYSTLFYDLNYLLNH